MKKNQLKTVSLFSGCGGMDIGFKNAGFNIVWANDNDKNAVKTYEKNIGKIDSRNIEDVNLEEIPDHQVLLAGFPCQAYSNAGTRGGVNDKRGMLYEYCLESIKIHKPDAVIFENVRGLLSIKGKNDKKLFDEICNTLEQFGYKVNWKLINSSDYEVPQNRIRVFIVAIKNSLKTEFIFPEPIPKTEKLKLKSVLKIPKQVKNQVEKKFSEDIIRLLPYIKEGGSWKDIPYDILPKRFKKIRDNMKRYRSPNFYRRFSREEINGTITATATPENCGIIHPTINRRYTLRECARIQSFEDSFIFEYSSISSCYKIIGNAVPPKLAEHLGNRLKELLIDPKDFRKRWGDFDHFSRQNRIKRESQLSINI
tara:strand:+ start:2343 stop:3443 length:1101 start_codon:yes stop_codon:yes gene_type:complete